MDNSKIKWYCYVCGKVLGPTFVLVSPREDTDRVFLCCVDDVEQVESEAYIRHVEGR